MRFAIIVLAVMLVPLSGCFGNDPEESTDDLGPQGPTDPGTTDPGGVTSPTSDGIENVSSTVIEPTPTPVASPTPPPALPAPPPPPPAAPPPASPPTTASPATSPTPTSPTPTSPTPTPTTPPTPTPPPPPPTSWPREGSHVTIEGSASESAPNTFQNRSDWTATWTYRSGDWHGVCSGTWDLDWDEDGEPDRDARGTFAATFEASDPPHWPLFNTRSPPDEGGSVEVWLMWDCRISSADMLYDGTVDHEDRGTMHTAQDTEEAEENYSDFDTHWDPETGLVMDWDWSRRNSGTSGRVTSTDAPVG